MSCWTSSLVKVLQISSSRSSSRWARSRSWRISRSPPSLTLRRTSLFAPPASSSGRADSSFVAPGLGVRVPAVLAPLALHAHLVLERGQILVALVLVDRRDHVGGEVDD